MRRLAYLGFILLLVSSPRPASATTALPIHDGLLADQAAVIAEGTVTASVPASAAGRPATEYRLRVERLIKGEAPAGTLTVRVPGGAAAGGLKLKVWGSPELRIGERALLFLVPGPDGAYAPLHLSMGTFHELRSGAGRLAVRDLSEIEVAGSREEGVRDLGRFGDWLRDRAAGVERPADYLVRSPKAGRAVEAFTYLGGVKQRWLEFDRGQDVVWRAHAAGQPGLAGGGFADFQAALQAWNADPATNIRYRYQGTTTATAGFQSFDGLNAIVFDDPNQEAPGSFSCPRPGVGSGVLAIGGTWYDDSRTPAVIQGADIVVNDGAGCWFTTGKRAEQVYGHELGHTLGLGHSCGDGAGGECDTAARREALMRATAHPDNRGARLGDDDRAAILTLYPGADAGARPAAPDGLAATAMSSAEVQLAWRDNSGDETGFRVEMKSPGTAFQQVLSVGPDVVTARVGGLKAGTAYTFRVRARNAGGFSAYSNTATVTTASAVAAPAAPAGLVAVPVSGTRIALSWQDRSSNETEFVIEAASPVSGFARVATAPADATAAAIDGLAPGTPYTFRVRARNAGGASAFSGLASAATRGQGGPCAADGQTLCLLGGRFRVQVRWKNGAAHGAGMAVPVAGSSQTGMFWFFGAENIELIVKVLDGTSVNDFYWTFYGGLSDVEYWITATDTESGESKTYYNPRGNLCGAGDVRSLPAAGTASAALGASAPYRTPIVDGVCAPGALCLLGGRFQVEVEWQLADGQQGEGTPVALTDQSGLFWFFGPENIELVVKVLDGQPVNGSHWFFYGALSDVAYRITVTDTTTGARKTYNNPAGSLCGRADTSAF